MPPTLEELRTPVTVTAAEELILALLEAVGFPATAWQKFSVPRTFVKLFSELYSDARTGITNIVESRLLDLAKGVALTYLARYRYQVERDPATATAGTFVLDDDGGAPYDIEVGQLVVRDAATNKRYTNTTAGSLASGGSLELTFKAEQTGSSYNISANSTLEFAETFEGVNVSNPPIGSTGTWITSTGTDEQGDESLREECRSKWATVGAGTADAYEAWALEGEPTISKVRVYGSEEEGAGGVRVVLATDSGGASATQVANAEAVIQAKRPIGLRSVTVVSATEVPITIAGTVNVYSGASTYAASLAAALQTMQRELAIGHDVTLTRIYALLHSPGGVRGVTLTSPLDDQGVDFDQIAVLSLGTITINTVSF